MLKLRTTVWIAIWAIFGVGGYFSGHAITVYQAPRTVMTAIEDRVVQGAGGWNTCMHNRTFGPAPGGAKRANPDSIISIMAYDLANGPVRITGDTWPHYWSISFYQQNSDNFYVTNDKQLGHERFDFVLSQEPDGPEAVDSSTNIESPTSKGIVLIRRLVRNEADMEGILANQDAMECGSIANGEFANS